jgi:hypothetical protein
LRKQLILFPFSFKIFLFSRTYPLSKILGFYSLHKEISGVKRSPCALALNALHFVFRVLVQGLEYFRGGKRMLPDFSIHPLRGMSDVLVDEVDLRQGLSTLT